MGGRVRSSEFFHCSICLKRLLVHRLHFSMEIKPKFRANGVQGLLALHFAYFSVSHTFSLLQFISNFIKQMWLEDIL